MTNSSQLLEMSRLKQKAGQCVPITCVLGNFDQRHVNVLMSTDEKKKLYLYSAVKSLEGCPMIPQKIRGKPDQTPVCLTQSSETSDKGMTRHIQDD